MEASELWHIKKGLGEIVGLDIREEKILESVGQYGEIFGR